MPEDPGDRAVGSQILASWLRILALIMLLPVGLVAGGADRRGQPQPAPGSLFQPLVSLSVAVILFDSGLELDLRKLWGHTRRVGRRLIVLGVPITGAFTSFFAALLLGMSKRSAIMLGAILVVSGPTVIGPLLNFVRPTERVQRVLIWEGSLIDPVGAILGALTFHAVVASSPGRLASGIGQFLASFGGGLRHRQRGYGPDRRDRRGPGTGEPPRLRHPGAPSVLRNRDPAHHRRALHLHLGHRDPGLHQGPGAVHPRPVAGLVLLALRLVALASTLWTDLSKGNVPSSGGWPRGASWPPPRRRPSRRR